MSERLLIDSIYLFDLVWTYWMKLYQLMDVIFIDLY